MLEARPVVEGEPYDCNRPLSGSDHLSDPLINFVMYVFLLVELRKNDLRVVLGGGLTDVVCCR